MIEGIGIDIIKIERLKRAIQRWGERMEKRIFTPQELAWGKLRGKKRLEYLGGRFAAKEAVAKSLGVNISWQEIEVRSEKNGKPYISLQGRMRKIVQERGIKEVLISLSHNDDYAIAQAVAIGKES